MPGRLQLACDAKEVRGMIELLLSSDEKHIVHVSAGTAEELAELAPKAKGLYEKIIESYGNTAQMWQLAIDNEPATLKNTREIPARAETHGGGAPICPMHDKPMKLRRGVYGTFWSCSARSPVGRWCSFTKEVSSKGDEKKATA
jgi:hypothetical protein